MSISNINRQACMELLMRFSRQIPQRLVSVQVANYSTIFTAAVDLATASTACQTTPPAGKFVVMEPESTYGMYVGFPLL